MKKSYLQLLQKKGFSIIPCQEDKRPLGSWKKYQDEARSFQEVGQLNSPLFGIVTGYNDVDCIDVDLKVLKTAKERREWWGEFISFLEDNILDFWQKFVVKKTKNDGYHILYRYENLKGNTKIATLKGHNEAIIESRGKGGMVIIYDKKAGELDYQGINKICEEDYDILWSVCKTYNYIEPPQKNIPDKKVEKNYKPANDEITPWDDFNDKNKVWDIVSDEFTIVRNLNDKYIIKRDGAKSSHSGYIYKDEDLMYLFSTGTQYEHERQYSAFSAYVKKHFNDDFSEATKKIYHDGYGSRIIKKEFEPKPDIEINKSNLEFPIDIFPQSIQNYLIECNHSLKHSIDYMGCSLLWLISLSIGNSMKVQIKPGWEENSTIWMSIVGKAGWGKTPSIKRIISPLLKQSSRFVKKYYDELEEYEQYESLSKKEKKEHPHVEKPSKKQFIANDITLEALVDLHGENDAGVGVFKDELAGWFKDMNKYREGSDLEFWLSCWSGSSVVLTRVTRKGSFIQRPSIPVLGGIQPGILNDFYTKENKDNGFIDRMLLCYPDLKSEYLTDKTIDHNVFTWFNDKIIYFYDVMNKNVVRRDEYGEINPYVVKMPPNVYKIYDQRHKEITDIENDKHENQYLKSMYPKQKAYIARFALLINTFNDYMSDVDSDKTDPLTISEDSMRKAIRLSDYFIETAKKVKTESLAVDFIKRVCSDKNLSIEKKVQKLHKTDSNFNKTEAAELLGVSRATIYNHIKKLKK